ncbi:hypothetical protein [Flavobacterium selenitireducens]|uniref:hypothetical protein n=1 Tax=Flavobacterium selenitireducens TaxID=2722704 RepID=UPI00168B35C7|nr:hypothetical protein [Flavobacterium selenitireducens]MBD3583188.1 hypothetical protein [Flavobacterium selenitireducens]
MKNFLLAFLFLCGAVVSAQFPQLHSEIPAKADWFVGFDNLGANYFVTDNTFYKEKERKLLQYQNISFGKIARGDLINPMNLVLFYKDFNAVVFLDNQLNEIRRINFSDFPEPLTVTAAGNASQNRLWIYNSINQQIGLYDFLKNTVLYLAQPIKGDIVHYETNFNHFYWIDDSGNRFSCDLFGKIISVGKFPVEPRTQFISDTSILYLKNKELRHFSLDGNTEQLVDLGEKSVLGFWYGAQNLAIFTSEGISLYKLKLR